MYIKDHIRCVETNHCILVCSKVIKKSVASISFVFCHMYLLGCNMIECIDNIGINYTVTEKEEGTNNLSHFLFSILSNNFKVSGCVGFWESFPNI